MAHGGLASAILPAEGAAGLRSSQARPGGTAAIGGEAGSRRAGTRWAPHLAHDIDPVVVDRLIARVPVEGYTSWERREAVRRMHRWGLTPTQIARRLDIHDRQVWRDLERLRLVTTGRLDRSRANAHVRRTAVARLAAAGVATNEIALLLHVHSGTVGDDRCLLGCPAPVGPPRKPRPLNELQRLYGHLVPSRFSLSTGQSGDGGQPKGVSLDLRQNLGMERAS